MSGRRIRYALKKVVLVVRRGRLLEQALAAIVELAGGTRTNHDLSSILIKPRFVSQSRLHSRFCGYCLL